MKRSAGFTWIELVMVLAVVGVLALMAIPLMSEGALRKQVKEGLELAAVAKTAVQDFYNLAGEFPPDNKAAGLPEAEKIVGTMVREVQVEGGAVTLTFGNNAHKLLNGRKITLRPAIVPDQPMVPIAWLCHAANVPNHMVVHGPDRTDLSNDMLPVECRAASEAKK
jgi:type IV pilus assembly protein PilA